jgi:hypothetical protein
MTTRDARYVVLIRTDPADKVFSVYLDADRADAEARRLRALGFDAYVRDATYGAPDWVGTVRLATRPQGGAAR